MITRIEALGYRCLRYVSQPLGPFHVLVGPNASGKTTFLDVIAFLGRLVSDGPDAAIEERTQNFYDLLWRREGTQFELAIEAQIPDELRERLLHTNMDTIRYEVALSIDSVSQERGLTNEQVVLKRTSSLGKSQRSKFSETPAFPSSLFRKSSGKQQRVLAKFPARPDFFRAEGSKYNLASLPWAEFGPEKSILASISSDKLFPVSMWLKRFLTAGIQKLTLDHNLLRRSSPAGQGLGLRPDGSNLPWVVAGLKQRSPERFRQWTSHLQTAFPDLQDITTIERPEDRHRYLVLQYREDLKVPSWMASDGTLRMLALTLPAYLEGFKGIYLIEEPENGIHPRAIETMTQSLSSVYDAQVLLATHSPIVLSTVEAEQILCFSKTPEGATDIIRGSEHPALRSWKHETTLGTLFAAGVLG
jgi:predicted ATPase